jgi:hypothetical protein
MIRAPVCKYPKRWAWFWSRADFPQESSINASSRAANGYRERRRCGDETVSQARLRTPASPNRSGAVQVLARYRSQFSW